MQLWIPSNNNIVTSLDSLATLAVEMCVVWSSVGFETNVMIMDFYSRIKNDHPWGWALGVLLTMLIISSPIYIYMFFDPLLVRFACLEHFIPIFPTYTQKILIIIIATPFRSEGIRLHPLAFMSSFGRQLLESLRCYLKCTAACVKREHFKAWKCNLSYHLALAPGADATQSDQPNSAHDGRNRHQEHAERHRAWGERHTEGSVSSDPHKAPHNSPFRGLYRCNQQRHPVICTPSLFPSSQHSSLSSLSSASHPEESSSQSREKWQKGPEPAPRSCSLHVPMEAHVSDRYNTRGQEPHN